MKRKTSIHELRIVCGFVALFLTTIVFALAWGIIVFFPFFALIFGVFAVFYGVGMMMEGFGADLRKLAEE